MIPKFYVRWYGISDSMAEAIFDDQYLRLKTISGDFHTAMVGFKPPEKSLFELDRIFELFHS